MRMNDLRASSRREHAQGISKNGASRACHAMKGGPVLGGYRLRHVLATGTRTRRNTMRTMNSRASASSSGSAAAPSVEPRR